MWSAVNRLQSVPPLSPTIRRVAAPIGDLTPAEWQFEIQSKNSGGKSGFAIIVILYVSDPSPDARQIGATADELGHQLAEDADKMTVSFWGSSPSLLVAFDIFSKVPQLADAIVEGQARPIAWETGAADFCFHNSACRGPSHGGPRPPP
jgi:hypothetical protein